MPNLYSAKKNVVVPSKIHKDTAGFYKTTCKLS